MGKFQFFRFLRQNLGGFDARFRKILKKILENRFSRTCQILKGTKSGKMSPFEAPSKNPRAKNHRGGAFCAPPHVE